NIFSSQISHLIGIYADSVTLRLFDSDSLQHSTRVTAVIQRPASYTEGHSELDSLLPGSRSRQGPPLRCLDSHDATSRFRTGNAPCPNSAMNKRKNSCNSRRL